MMLNLMRQIASQNVKPFIPFDIARTQNLTHIPVAFALISIEMGIDVSLLCKMATENHRPRPQITNRIGRHVATQCAHSATTT